MEPTALSAQKLAKIQARGISPHDVGKAYGDNVCVFIGKTRSGKDVATRHVLAAIQSRTRGQIIVFSGTNGFASDADNIPGATRLDATKDSLALAFSIRRRQAVEAKAEGRTLPTQTWIFNDVATSSLGVGNNQSELSSLTTMCRHMNVRVIILMQYLNAISRVIRTNASVFVTLQLSLRDHEILCRDLGFEKRFAQAAATHSARPYHPVVYPRSLDCIGETAVPLFLTPFPYGTVSGPSRGRLPPVRGTRSGERPGYGHWDRSGRRR